MAEGNPQDDHERDADGSALRRADSQQARANREARVRSSGDSSLSGQVVHKVCCQCGDDLNHRPRFKDSKGRYWCPVCNEKEHLQKLDTACADCHIQMPRDEMRQLYGRLLCPVCFDARQAGPKGGVELRSAQAMPAVGAAPAYTGSRLGAQERRQILTVAIIAVVIVLLIALAVWALARG